MNPQLVHLPHGRLAVRVDGDTLLAVPPLDPRLPRFTRRQVFDAVLRRQPGLAQTIADIELDVIEGREKTVGKRASALMAEQPYSRGWAA